MEVFRGDGLHHQRVGLCRHHRDRREIVEQRWPQHRPSIDGKTRARHDSGISVGRGTRVASIAMLPTHRTCCRRPRVVQECSTHAVPQHVRARGTYARQRKSACRCAERDRIAAALRRSIGSASPPITRVRRVSLGGGKDLSGKPIGKFMSPPPKRCSHICDAFRGRARQAVQKLSLQGGTSRIAKLGVDPAIRVGCNCCGGVGSSKQARRGHLYEGMAYTDRVPAAARQSDSRAGNGRN